MSARITIRVKPGSTKGPLVVESPDGLTVYVRERAVDGAANAAVERTLASHLGVAASRVRIVRGQSARIKHVEIAD